MAQVMEVIEMVEIQIIIVMEDMVEMKGMAHLNKCQMIMKFFGKMDLATQ